MHRATPISLLLFVAPLAISAQQVTTPPAAPPAAAPHDTVHGAIRAVDVRARTLEVTTGVGFALRIMRLDVPAGVPITDREGAQAATIALAALKPGDVVRATVGARPTGLVAYTIERVGRMATGVESTP